MLTAPLPPAAGTPSGSASSNFSTFYTEAAPVVHAFLRRRCSEAFLAEDLCQETMLTAFRAFSEGREINVAWAIGVARHKLREHHRRTTREQRRLERAGAASLPAVVTVADDGGPLPGLDRLPDRQQQVLLLRYRDDHPVHVVAARLGLTIRATESLLARARRTLRTSLFPGPTEGRPRSRTGLGELGRGGSAGVAHDGTELVL